jgi:hypothetical protein
MNKSIFVALAVAAGSAQALTYTVDAHDNSSTFGVGKATIHLIAGQTFSVTADPADLWSSGPSLRWSNADGQISQLYATGSDDSGKAAGTLIGIEWRRLWGRWHGSPILWTQGNLTAPFGALVGQIGDGDYFLVGTSYTGRAAAGGTLKLFFWDTNNDDNAQSISAKVTGVPEPMTGALMFGGLGAMAFVARRRQRAIEARGAARVV